ncbi:MAG: GTPase-associated system all-helical protein GASH [Acetobacter sp.]|uniref:GTPase-associated system all-helical protein GASH n=1 Tax=Acetobacter sp. TaxID=440 RepID=UPI0039E9CA77
MSDEILLQFLEAGVVDVGADDAKLQKLRDTAENLAAVLKKTPAQAVSWTLVACDPEIASSDPVIANAWAALKANWATVANIYQGAIPVAVLRAILLDALMQVSLEDDSVAVSVANSARNMLPHMALGNEAEVWRRAVKQIEDQADARAESEWTTPEAIHIDPIAYEAPGGIKIVQEVKVVEREVLQPKVLAAAGPTGGTNPNPYWPNNNNPQQIQNWAIEFSKRMSDAIGDAIDGVAKANAINPIDLSDPLSELAESVSSYVGQAMTAFSGATIGLQRRTNLIWWKETLYSPSTRVSYRTMDSFTAASIMALDLFDQVPTFSPASVSAFLNEAILQLPEASSWKGISVPVIVERLLADPLCQPLHEVAKQLAPSSEGRMPLLAILAHSSADAVAKIAFRQASGLDERVTMSPNAWGTHLFRELQAARATRPIDSQ